MRNDTDFLYSSQAKSIKCVPKWTKKIKTKILVWIYPYEFHNFCELFLVIVFFVHYFHRIVVTRTVFTRSRRKFKIVNTNEKEKERKQSGMKKKKVRHFSF